MAKSTLWQWSSTNASNTDIGGTDITGSTGLVKNGDNAIREIMAQMAASEAKGADVASASTIALGTGRFFHITGTTTITDIDFTDAVNGRWAVLEFDGALTLTHNATTLTLPGGANITTAAGDRAFIVQDSGDNMHVLFYQAYATGAGPFLPLAGGTLTGNLTVSKASPTATLNKAASGQDALLYGQTAGVNRWGVDLGTTASESGSDAGSDFAIIAYTDAGAFIDVPVNIVRVAGGAISLQRPITLTKQLNEAPTVTIASASTVNIGAAASNQIIISGTTTITGLGTIAAGVTREVLFSGALTLTHNGTSLILPGTANITTAANDTAKFRSLGSGNWVCLWYKKADGTSIGASGGMTLLGTLTTTSGTTQSVTSIAAGYRAIFCEVDGVSFTTATSLTIATSSTNGAAYGTAGTITGSLSSGSGSFIGAIRVYNVSSTSQSQVASSAMYSGGDKSVAVVPCVTDTAAVVNAIQFAGGTFDAGTIRVYGVK